MAQIPVEKGRKTKAQKATCFSILSLKSNLASNWLLSSVIHIRQTNTFIFCTPEDFRQSHQPNVVFIDWDFASVANMFVQIKFLVSSNT